MKLAGLLALLGAVTITPAMAQPRFEVYESRAPNGMPVYTVKSPGHGVPRPVYVFEGRALPGPRPGGIEALAFHRVPSRVPLRMPSRMPSRVPPARDGSGFIAMAVSASQRHGVDAALVLAVMEVESAFDAGALSPAGAIGLMQLMPQTARRYGANPWVVQANVDAGVRYLRDLIHLFGGDLRLALAGYNAGEHRVIRSGYRVPAIAETLSYVPKVLARHRDWGRHLAADELKSLSPGAIATERGALP